jgi:hypothetical protein
LQHPNPVLEQVHSKNRIQLVQQPQWFPEGISILKRIVTVVIERDFYIRRWNFSTKPAQNNTESKPVRKSSGPRLRRSYPENKTVSGRRRNAVEIGPENLKNTATVFSYKPMIVPMFKYAFLVYHRDYLHFLNELQQVGVLHIMPQSTEEYVEHPDNKSTLLLRVKEKIRFLEKRLSQPTNNFR